MAKTRRYKHKRHKRKTKRKRRVRRKSRIHGRRSTGKKKIKTRTSIFTIPESNEGHEQDRSHPPIPPSPSAHSTVQFSANPK